MRWHTVVGKPVTPPTEWRQGGGSHYLKVFGLLSHSERKKENWKLHLVFLCGVLWWNSFAHAGDVVLQICSIKWFKCHLPVSLWLLVCGCGLSKNEFKARIDINHNRNYYYSLPWNLSKMTFFKVIRQLSFSFPELWYSLLEFNSRKNLPKFD